MTFLEKSEGMIRKIYCSTIEESKQAVVNLFEAANSRIWIYTGSAESTVYNDKAITKIIKRKHLQVDLLTHIDDLMSYGKVLMPKKHHLLTGYNSNLSFSMDAKLVKDKRYADIKYFLVADKQNSRIVKKMPSNEGESLVHIGNRSLAEGLISTFNFLVQYCCRYNPQLFR